MAYKVYLAGPDVFLPDAHEVGRRKQEMCRAFGFEGLLPYDKDPDIGRDPLKIFHKNCESMGKADAGVFNLTPFRGPSADVGTVFELGYMFLRGKPVYGYTSDPRGYRERVSAILGVTEVAGVPRDRDQYEVENFGWRDNLMIAGAIEEAGGVIAAVAESGAGTSKSFLAAFAAFEACLQTMRERIGRSSGEIRQSYSGG